VQEDLPGLGRLFYSPSTLICTQTAKSQAGGYVLRAQAGTRQIEKMCRKGGFTRFQLVEQTPVNRNFEVRR